MCALPPYPAAIRGTCAGEHNDVVVSHNGMDVLRNTCSEEGNDADAEDSDMADFHIRVAAEQDTCAKYLCTGETERVNREKAAIGPMETEAAAIARALNVSVVWLFGESNEPQPINQPGNHTIWRMDNFK